MEASRRIELLYTDLQSAASPLRQLASALKTRVFVVGGVIGRFRRERKRIPEASQHFANAKDARRAVSAACRCGSAVKPRALAT